MIERITIERAEGAPELSDIRTASLAEGIDFVERANREWAEGTNRFDRPGEVFYLARVDGGIIGICGLNIDPYMTDPLVGRLRHLYVAPSARGRGAGRALVESCLNLATGRFHRVRLRMQGATASGLYESIGFRPTDEPEATHSLLLAEWSPRHHR